MAVLTATSSFDMTDWNFGNIDTGTITRQTSFQHFITGGDGVTHYEFTGVGLTYNGSNELTGGTVTGYRVLDDEGNTLLSLTGFSLAATIVATAINTSDAGGVFENTVFGAGDNTINGSDGDDILTDSANQDTIHAGAGNDLILLSKAGFNTITGDAGDDTLYIGAEAILSTFDGGDGQDTAIIDRSNSYLVQVGDAGIKNIESLILTGSATRNTIVTDDGALEAGATLRVDASALGGSTRFIFGGAGETDGHFDIVGSAGRDALLGGDLTDSFHLEKGGADRVVAGLGEDQIYMGASLTGQDRLNGGDGTSDFVFVDGNYSSGTTLGAHTLTDVEGLIAQAGHDYKFTSHDGNVKAGETLTIGAMYLGNNDTMDFDGSAELDGGFIFIDGHGDDLFKGGGDDDEFDLVGGGDNVVSGGAGDDTFIYYIAFDVGEVIDGGDGDDELQLLGDHSTGLVFTAATMVNVESISLNSPFSYDITLDDANVAAGETLTVLAGLAEDESATIDGSAETDGKFAFSGGDGDDNFIGGARADTFNGGAGVDHLTGGAGNDTFIYLSAGDSTSRFFDTINGLDGGDDSFDVGGAIVARDLNVNGGTLNLAGFDARLASKIDAAALGANNFVIYTPGSGDFDGATFLIVDQNGVAGYQGGSDLVILLTSATHLGGLAATDFI